MQTGAAVHITEMTLDDYPEVAALWQACDGVGFSPSDTREGIARLLARNPRLSFVARSASGELAGAILGSHDGMRAFLRHLAVARAYRRHGIGHALVERCLAGFAGLGLMKCTLFMFPDNGAGREFWESLGWRERTDLRVLQRALEPQAPAPTPAPSQPTPQAPAPRTGPRE
jgi:N-acetylglutamate synthase